MKYNDSNKVICVGDSVLYAGAPGRIVFIVDDDAYSSKYPKQDWSHLAKGLGVEMEDREHTLYHLESPDEDLSPVASAESSGASSPSG